MKSCVLANPPGYARSDITSNRDHGDRMTGITGTSSYGYDYQGRRSGKTVGTTTTYLYDGLNLIREAGASTADYLFGPGIDEPLAMSRSGQVYYYGIDGLGSASLVTDSSGAVQDSYLYDAWGQTRSQTGSVANPFGYTAREVGEAGTLFYRARYYSAAVGRFLSEDPLVPAAAYAYASGLLAQPVAVTPYAYARSSAIRLRDPLGLDAGGANQGDTKCVFDCGQTYSSDLLKCNLTLLQGTAICTFGLGICLRTTPPPICLAAYLVCEAGFYGAYIICEATASHNYTNCLKKCRCPSN